MAKKRRRKPEVEQSPHGSANPAEFTETPCDSGAAVTATPMPAEHVERHSLRCQLCHKFSTSAGPLTIPVPDGRGRVKPTRIQRVCDVCALTYL